MLLTPTYLSFPLDTNTERERAKTELTYKKNKRYHQDLQKGKLVTQRDL